jgi:hypothetical protein
MLKMLDSLGVDGYEREWRHLFPLEACEKLYKASVRAKRYSIIGVISPFHSLIGFGGFECKGLLTTPMR